MAICIQMIDYSNFAKKYITVPAHSTHLIFSVCYRTAIRRHRKTTNRHRLSAFGGEAFSLLDKGCLCGEADGKCFGGRESSGFGKLP